MFGTLFSPLALRAVVPLGDVVEGTLLADQAQPMVAALTEENTGWGGGGGGVAGDLTSG